MTNVTPPAPAWQMKAFPLFALLGWVLILISFLIGLFVLSTTAAGYWGGNAKAVRDAAEAGSALLGQLQTLTVTPRWLEPLTFLGVASFMHPRHPQESRPGDERRLPADRQARRQVGRRQGDYHG